MSVLRVLHITANSSGNKEMKKKKTFLHDESVIFAI